MVGNGVCDTVYDGNALVPFVHGMGLISDDLFQVCFVLNFDMHFHYNIEKFEGKVCALGLDC